MSMRIIQFSLISLACGSLRAHGAESLPLSKDYWKSDAFKKAFNGSYRINARIEPFVDTKERVLLVAVQEMMAKGDRGGALKKLKASSLANSSAAVMFNIGNISFETGDLAEAEKQYLAAVKKFPTFLRAYQNLAFVYAREAKYEEAFPHLLEVVRLGSQDGSVMGLLGYCYQEKGNFTSALQAFKNAQLTEPDNLEWKIGEAYCYDSLGDDAKALNLYESIVKEKLGEPQYMFLLINLYQRTGQIEEAIVNLELLRRQGKLDVSNQLLLGALHLSDGSLVIGSDVIREVLKSEELTDGELAMNAIGFAIERREYELALEFHGLVKPELVEKFTSKVRYQRQQAQILILQGQEVEKAVGILRGLIASDPLDADSLYLLAKYEATNRQEELALLHFAQAHAGKGKMKNAALLERGKVLVFLKRYEEALKDLKEYQVYAEGSQLDQLKAYVNGVENLLKASQ